MIGADASLVIARIAIGSLFAVSAIDKFRLDPMEVKQVASLRLPAPPELLMRLTGAFELIGALALGVGLYARIAALGLAAFIAFVSPVFLRFWSIEAPRERVAMRDAFMGNVALIGGLIYIIVCGVGSFAICDL